MRYPVPPSRLRPPRTAREVSRLRPLGLVEAAFGKSPGVVLAAGPGYGKTSLAAEMGGVYLALAEEAKDPAVFLWHLLYAYRDRAGLSEAARLLEGGAWPRAPGPGPWRPSSRPWSPWAPNFSSWTRPIGRKVPGS